MSDPADPTDSMDERAARRRRGMSVAVAHSAADVDRFDREFWRRAGHEARFAAAWQMVIDRELMRGDGGERQLRLQRSVAVLERRGCADLSANERASGRLQDLLDVSRLENDQELTGSTVERD